MTQGPEDKLRQFLRTNRPEVPAAPVGAEDRAWRAASAAATARWTRFRRPALFLGPVFAAASLLFVLTNAPMPGAGVDDEQLANEQFVSDTMSLSFLDEFEGE